MGTSGKAGGHGPHREGRDSGHAAARDPAWQRPATHLLLGRGPLALSCLVVADWAEWLSKEDEQQAHAVRRQTACGRACGSEAFVMRLEQVAAAPPAASEARCETGCPNARRRGAVLMNRQGEINACASPELPRTPRTPPRTSPELLVDVRRFDVLMGTGAHPCGTNIGGIIHEPMYLYQGDDFGCNRSGNHDDCGEN
jgi:hypothetical protein